MKLDRRRKAYLAPGVRKPHAGHINATPAIPKNGPLRLCLGSGTGLTFHAMATTDNPSILLCGLRRAEDCGPLTPRCLTYEKWCETCLKEALKIMERKGAI